MNQTAADAEEEEEGEEQTGVAASSLSRAAGASTECECVHDGLRETHTLDWDRRYSPASSV